MQSWGSYKSSGNLAGSHGAVVRQLSGSRLAVIWQSFGSCTYKNVAVYKMKVVSFLFLAKDEN